jgi:hypothetical protein
MKFRAVNGPSFIPVKRRGRPPGIPNKKPPAPLVRSTHPIDLVLVNEFLAQANGIFDSASIHAFSGAVCKAVRRVLKHHGYGYDA